MSIRLAPAEFVQTVVVDPEVVRDLVDHCDGYFIDHFFARAADVQDGLPEDGDPVRQ
ncbi:hypothetical protein D3C85_1802090 [compost metagenome]